jgi:hypothetical protein
VTRGLEAVAGGATRDQDSLHERKIGAYRRTRYDVESTIHW